MSDNENAIETMVEKIENFVEQNKQTVSIIGCALELIIAATLFVTLKWLPERDLKAKREMYMAEIAFQKDSFNLALNDRSTADGGVPADGAA